MKAQPTSAIWGGGLLAAVALLLMGCGKSSTSAEAGTNPANPLLESGEEGTGSSGAGEAKIVAPAHVSDAEGLFDLSRVALLAGAEQPAEQTAIGLMYRAPGGPEGVFKFHRDQLTAAGWKELPGSSVTPQYVSAAFEKRGMHLSLAANPDQPGKTGITLRHHGNISLGDLSVPSGAKSIYSGPFSAIFAVDLPVETSAQETAIALRKLGWAPYGSSGNTHWFKQNAVKLSVMTAASPAQGGKTTISFTSEMLPIDVPIPESATDVQISNASKRLMFQVAFSQEECVAYYREALGKTGWKSTMETTVKVDADNVLVFRNAANDMLELGMRAGRDGKLHVAAKQQSAAEIAEMNRRLDAQAAAYKAAKAGAATSR